jgi:hypothetical protein
MHVHAQPAIQATEEILNLIFLSPAVGTGRLPKTAIQCLSRQSNNPETSKKLLPKVKERISR